MNELARGYWCECWTQDLEEEQRPVLHASIDAYSAAQADRWITVALRTISPTRHGSVRESMGVAA